MAVRNDIKDLLDAEVIDQSTADRIEAYYDSTTRDTSSILLLVFGVLGALLIGLGIILILAHNWDTLPLWIKTILAFIPLITGQLLCGYVLRYRASSDAWRESTATFLTLSIGASIALVSQIYHLEGDLAGFLLIWMILALLIIYVMDSGAAAFLYLIGLVWHTVMNIADHSILDFGVFALLLGALIPFYWHEMKTNWGSNLLSFFHYLIPIAIWCGCGTLIGGETDWVMMMYMNLFGVFYMIGHRQDMRRLPLRSNGYLVIGSLGTIVLLLIHSFGLVWEDMRLGGLLTDFDDGVILFGFASTWIAAMIGIIYHYRRQSVDRSTPIMPMFLIFIAVYWIANISSVSATILINIIILAVSVLTILAGVSRDHLGILNYGLLILTALLICRFFDTDITFVLRGLLFILVGISFFLANNYLIRKRKTNDQ